MKFLSVCSGIEAASCAWHPLGWRAHAFAEIEKFPSAVLAHHYPAVPNWGDMTKFKDWPDAAFDVLVGGTPCQSFSVAGLRKGMADPRGNLALVYLGILDRYRPRWMVWENVPGVLSSNGGRDFGSFLGGLGELGYGFAYRVLDAQFFGLAQRRKRVFVVGHLGDWRRAAAVLFEPHSLSGHPAPRREAGKGTAPTLAARTRGGGGGGLGTDFGCDGGLIAFGGGNQAGALDVATAQTAQTAHAGRFDFESDTFVMQAGAVRENPNSGPDGIGVQTSIAYTLEARSEVQAICFSAKDHGADAMSDLSPTLRAGGHDGSHANAGVMPAIAFQEGGRFARTQEANTGALLRRVRDEIGEEAFAKWGLGILDTLQPPEILRSALHGSELRPAAFSRRWVVYCTLSREEDRAQGAVQSMREAAGEGRASQGWQPSQQLARELGAYLSELPQPGAQAERFMHDLWVASEGLGVLREALSAVQKARRPARSEGQSTLSGWRVRRLIVEECEFLQGFPRGYTAIPHRGKPAADGPRYKALGNSMAVPVMAWIGERIEAVDAMRSAA